MDKSQIVVEQLQIAKLALFSLIAGLPVAAGYSFISAGDSVLWAQVENALSSITPEAKAAGPSVTHNFPAGWTNNPNWNVVVTDCDCPPAAPAPETWSDDGDDGDDDSDDG